MLQNFGQKLSCVDDNNYMQGEIPLQKRNYLLECGPLVVQAYPTHQASVLGTHLYQCNIRCCCERLCSASVIIFWRLFQCICPFHDGWFTGTPAHIVLTFQQVLTKNCSTLMPHLPYSPDLSPRDIFCLPGWKKSSKENILWMLKRLNKKQQKHLKASKSTSSKTVLSSEKTYW